MTSNKSSDKEFDAALALSLAVDKKITLVGASDVRRLTDLQSRLAETGGVQLENRHLQKIEKGKEPVFRVSDAASSAIQMIRVDPAVALTAKEVKKQGRGDRKKFKVRDEAVRYKKDSN